MKEENDSEQKSAKEKKNKLNKAHRTIDTQHIV